MGLDTNILVRAMEAFRDFQAGTADFADCLIGRRNRGGGCDATWTFDVRAGSLASYRLLETPPTTT
jgi:predicted nucleic-acid-binding protein